MFIDAKVIVAKVIVPQFVVSSDQFVFDQLAPPPCLCMYVWEKVHELCSDGNYIEVVSALSSFDKWSSLASTVDLHLSDEHLKRLCCPEKHDNDECCATSILVKRLENLGGFW